MFLNAKGDHVRECSFFEVRLEVFHGDGVVVAEKEEALFFGVFEHLQLACSVFVYAVIVAV